MVIFVERTVQTRRIKWENIVIACIDGAIHLERTASGKRKEGIMKPVVAVLRPVAVIVGLGWLSSPATPAAAQSDDAIRIVEERGLVEVQPRGAGSWVLTQTNQVLHTLDRVRTRDNSSMGLSISGSSVLHFDALSEVEILDETTRDGQGLHLIHGILSFFHRGQPGRVRVISGGALAGVEGTEFVMTAAQTNEAPAEVTLSVIDGKVRFENAGGVLVLTNGEQASALSGEPPRRTSGFDTRNLLQWCFYYPGILDLNELAVPAATQGALADSLAAYRAGSLPEALAKYPAGRTPDSDAERVYRAALLLAMSQVTSAESQLADLRSHEPGDRNQRLAWALRTLIAAVKREALSEPTGGNLNSEWLARSYYEQSRAGAGALDRALADAERAATNSTAFGFAWERAAELQFSFGRIDRAQARLDRALQLSPRNAQALALNGFLLAARNCPRQAILSFDDALAVDSALGNAWLGRGLCRIRLGDLRGGRQDLLIAAAMEPERASLRSYLGKAFGDAGDFPRALHELNLAKRMDTNDPTAWLYSALIDEDNNRLNDAVRDLEESQELNDNRSLYRSRLLLDQDHAVRSANLARIYQEAGLDDVAVREAVRAVDDDYANYSAHYFLANSYNALRDPNQINLRYETPTYVEYLIGNLLSPANAGVLSPSISQQEYSRLFDRDRFGVFSDTEYLSRGAWTESGAQYATLKNSSYDFEAFYRSDPGQRPNNDVEQRQLSLTLKQQLTPHDTLFGMVSQYEGTGGDLRQYYDQANADLGLRTRETQDPFLILGFNHEWEPGSHTLLLAGRLDDTYEVHDAQSPVQSFLQPVANSPYQGVVYTVANQDYRSQTVIYTAELQQIWQRNEHTLIAGGRFQDGSFDTHNFLNNPEPVYFFPGPPYELNQNENEDFLRLSAYGYYFWKALDSLQLTVGLTYDWMTFPEDFRMSPIAGGRQDEGQLSPKAGLIWTPFEGTVIHAAFTRSLGGASLEQSFQLEPSEVAGFNQLFRSLIPESVEGENAGARFETWNVELEQKLGRDVYFAMLGQLLKSKVDRQSGDTIVGSSTYSSTTPERLEYAEYDLQANLDYLLGSNWAVGIQYQLTDARLRDQFLDIDPSILPMQRTSALLHQIELHASFNHPCGVFANFEALWNDQHNLEYTIPEPSQAFWQFNAFAGYRFSRRRAEVSIGVINIAGHDYQLNPLTSVTELPRARNLVMRLKLDF